jgi:hypothetical protein
MMRMEIESENDSSINPQLNYHHIPYPETQCGSRGETASPSLSLDEARTLKKKQEENILNKIEKIVQKVTPIHEADYESDNENDMHDLIEEFEKMDVE